MILAKHFHLLIFRKLVKLHEEQVSLNHAARLRDTVIERSTIVQYLLIYNLNKVI